MNVSMVIHLLMLAYAFSTAFDLYIFHHMNRLSFLLMLLNVVFLRYSDDQNGFLCYDPQARRTCLFLNVVFIEHNLYYSLPSDSTTTQVSYLLEFPTQFSLLAITEVYVQRSEDDTHC